MGTDCKFTVPEEETECEQADDTEPTECPIVCNKVSMNNWNPIADDTYQMSLSRNHGIRINREKRQRAKFQTFEASGRSDPITKRASLGIQGTGAGYNALDSNDDTEPHEHD